MKLQPEQLLKLRSYNPDTPPPPDQIVLRIEQKNLGSLGNFVTISGLPKRGKGKFISAITASALTGKDVFGINCHLPESKRKVGFFDTDQSRYDFYKNIELINQLAGLNKISPSLFAYNVRQDEAGDIIKMIDAFLNQNKNCGLLIIDNIGDLLNNFNDEGQSKALINYFKKITTEENLLIITTLHLGKSNNSTIGHLGAMSDRYAQTTFTCEKIESAYHLKIKDSRTAGDITPIVIYYDEYNNTWKDTSYQPEPDEKIKPFKPKARELDYELHQRSVRRIFSIDEFLTYSDLVEEIKQTYAAGTNWAKECLIYLQDQQLIFKVQGGYTNRREQKLFIQK